MTQTGSGGQKSQQIIRRHSGRVWKTRQSASFCDSIKSRCIHTRVLNAGLVTSERMDAPEKDVINLEKAHEGQLKISSGWINCLTEQAGTHQEERGKLKGDNIIKAQRNLQQINDLKPRNRDRAEVYPLRCPKQQFWMLRKKGGHAVTGNKTVGEFQSI